MEYTEEEFKEMTELANKKPYSPFALFMFTHSGYAFYRNGRPVDKWEVYGNDVNLYERRKK